MQHYVANSEEDLLKFVAESMKLDPDAIEEKDKFQKGLAQQKADKLKSMKLHGQFENLQTSELKTKDSWNWLSKGDLKRETESLLMAAQEQALNTNSIKKSIYGISSTDKCRLCGSATESVTHIISQYSVLAQEYKRRHDKVCLNIHWASCKKFGFEFSDQWYQHIPTPVLKNDEVKLLWDSTIQIDRKIDHYRPDTVVFLKKNRYCKIVDVAIPGDHRIDRNEIEKITNYGDLKLEISRMWNCKTIVIPVSSKKCLLSKVLSRDLISTKHYQL